MCARNRPGHRWAQGGARRSGRIDGGSWSSRPVATRFIDGGGAEQDPHEMWQAIVDATRGTLGAAQPVPPIVAVAVTSQYMSVVPVAADGMPTGPCVLWMDTRGAEHNRSLLTEESFVLFVERHGLIPLPRGNDNVAHIHVLRDVPSRTRTRRRLPSSSRWTTSTPGSPDESVRPSRRCSGRWCATTAPGGSRSTTRNSSRRPSSIPTSLPRCYR